MADLVTDGTSLTLAMSRVEHLEGFRGDLHAPLASVSAVRAVADPWTELRGLRAPGTGVPGVIGSGAFVGWYNSHPDGRAPAVDEVRSAVIIGNGNVAIDVARILAKHPDELAGSDLSPEIVSSMRSQSSRFTSLAAAAQEILSLTIANSPSSEPCGVRVR